MTVITMSRTELTRLRVLIDVADVSGSHVTRRWSGMDSNFQYRDTSPPRTAWAPSFGGVAAPQAVAKALSVC
jgi:hypothetical protein